jgi:predicted Zn-dependent protease
MSLSLTVLLTLGAASVLIWLAFFYFGSKGISRRGNAAREQEIRFELAAAPHSDRHVESLLVASPKNEDLLRRYAWNAAERQDWPEALRRADMYIARLPNSAGGWLSRSGVLRMSGQEEESVALLRKLVRHKPKDPEVLLAWSEEAIRRQDWAEAVRRLERLRKRAPDWPQTYLLAADALVAIRRREEAEAILAEGMRRLPEHWTIWQKAAWLAEAAGDLQGAVRHWDDMRARFPREPAGFLGGAEALAKAGETEAAAALIQQGRDYFPGNKAIKEAVARLAPEAPQDAVPSASKDVN